jgi:hypothetical protein
MWREQPGAVAARRRGMGRWAFPGTDETDPTDQADRPEPADQHPQVPNQASAAAPRDVDGSVAHFLSAGYWEFLVLSPLQGSGHGGDARPQGSRPGLNLSPLRG